MIGWGRYIYRPMISETFSWFSDFFYEKNNFMTLSILILINIVTLTKHCEFEENILIFGLTQKISVKELKGS